MPSPPENGSHEPPFVNTGSRYKKQSLWALALLMLNIAVHIILDLPLIPDAFVHWVVLDRNSWPGAATHQLSLVSTLVVLVYYSVTIAILIWLRQFAASQNSQRFVGLNDGYLLRWMTFGAVALFTVVQNFDFIMTIEPSQRALATNDMFLGVWAILISAQSFVVTILLVDPQHFNHLYAAAQADKDTEKRL